MKQQTKMANFPIHDLKQLDKLARSILLSTPEIGRQNILDKSIKNRILKAIQSDNVRQLSQIIQQQIISFSTQIGTRGSKWNILHFCGKNNSQACLQYILKTQFQEHQEEYQKFINEKTVQGYTVLVVAIINRSCQVLQKLLYYGGSDIYVLDQSKMNPYQIAINYKNDRAIRLLMNYQSRIKKKQIINGQALSIPVYFYQPSFYQTVTNYLICCFTFGIYSRSQGLISKRQWKGKISEQLPKQTAIDYVALNSRKQLQGYDIQWKRAIQLTSTKISIFNSYNPFEIQQSNFTIRNCLILFQCLSQQPWLIRKCIKMEQNKNSNQYSVVLYPHRVQEVQSIDDFIPFIKERKQPMFLSNRQELWPMLLQKALAKQYGSYFSLSTVNPLNLLQNITGFPTIQIPLTSLQNKKIISYLQQIASKNYLFLLRSKKQSQLYDEISQEECCTVLNFYQKNQQAMILVNCSFISQKYKEKQIEQTLALKIIKSHYNMHKQMCVWIQEAKIREFYESVIVSLNFQNYARSELKIKGNQFVFFKFRVQNKNIENIYLQLSNMSTEQIYNLQKLQVIRNEGKQLLPLIETDIKQYTRNLAQLQSHPGQYMCFYQTPTPSLPIQNLLLLCWSPELILTQLVQSDLGILQWLGFIKNHFKKIQGEQCVLEVIGQFALVLLRENTQSAVILRIKVDDQQLIEGKKDQTTGYIQMISQQNIHYCVTKRVIASNQISFDYKKV